MAIRLSLRDHGISQHLVWAVQCLYSSQEGRVVGNSGRSCGFAINAGVRQGCVLSPNVFTRVFFNGRMANWRRRVTAFDFGMDLHHGVPNFLDSRFASDIPPFASCAHDVASKCE